MKKKVVLSLFALVFLFLTSAVVVRVNITLNGSKINLSDIALSNIEVLAKKESGHGYEECDKSNCPGGCCRFTFLSGLSCEACCPNGDIAECNTLYCDCV